MPCFCVRAFVNSKYIHFGFGPYRYEMNGAIATPNGDEKVPLSLTLNKDSNPSCATEDLVAR